MRSVTVWRRKLKKLWELCEGPDFKWKEKPLPHRFRHTFARILLQRPGVTVRDVAELLGDTEDMVRKHYAAWVSFQQHALDGARFTGLPVEVQVISLKKDKLVQFDVRILQDCTEPMKNTGSYIITGAERGMLTTRGARATTPASGDTPKFSAKMTAFLAAIQVLPMVTRAARAAGIHRGSHYRKLKSSAAYANAFEYSLMIGCDNISDLAVERAMIGWEEPIVYRGSIAMRKDPDTGELIPLTVRKFDNRLLAFLLERRHPAHARRMQPSAESPSDLAERLDAGRRRVAKEKARRDAEREAEEKAKRDAAIVH